MNTFAKDAVQSLSTGRGRRRSGTGPSRSLRTPKHERPARRRAKRGSVTKDQHLRGGRRRGVGLRLRRPGGAVSLRGNGAGEQGAAAAARAIFFFLVQGAVGAVLIRLGRLLHILEGRRHLLALLLLRAGEARQVRAVGLGSRCTPVAGSIGPATACCEERSARADHTCNAKGVEKASPRYVGLIVRSHERRRQLVKKRVREGFGEPEGTCVRCRCVVNPGVACVCRGDSAGVTLQGPHCVDV